MIGQSVSVRGISGTVERVVMKGDRFKDRALSHETYKGQSFVVIRDDRGRAHHAFLDEVA